MSRWWRAYDEAVDDPKLILLTDQQHRAWFNLCCIASQSGGVLPAVAVIAVKLRVKPDRARHMVAELMALGLIDHDGMKFEMHNWADRQYQAQNEAPGKGTYVYIAGQNWDGHVKIGISKNPWARLGELQTGSPLEMAILATFRCQKKFHSEVDLHELLKPWRGRGEWFELPATIIADLKNYYAEKKSYDDVVGLLRSKKELLRSNAVVATTTESERTEAETEKKEDCRESVPTRYPEDFENGFWKPYPRTPVMSKKEALTAWKRLAPEDREKAVAAVNPYLAFLRAKPDHPAVHACRFLSQRRFDGFAAAPLEAEQRKIIRPRHGQILGPEFGEKATGKVFVLAETREWDAWCSYARSIGKPAPPRYFHEGWAFTTLWPPGYEPQTEAAE